MSSDGDDLIFGNRNTSTLFAFVLHYRDTDAHRQLGGQKKVSPQYHLPRLLLLPRHKMCLIFGYLEKTARHSLAKTQHSIHKHPIIIFHIPLRKIPLDGIKPLLIRNIGKEWNVRLTLSPISRQSTIHEISSDRFASAQRGLNRRSML